MLKNPFGIRELGRPIEIGHFLGLICNLRRSPDDFLRFFFIYTSASAFENTKLFVIKLNDQRANSLILMNCDRVVPPVLLLNGAPCPGDAF